MTTTWETNEAEVAHARSSVYGLLANTFRYPDQTLLKTLEDPERWSVWPSVIRRLDVELGKRLDRVRDQWMDNSRHPSDRFNNGDNKLQDTFVHLFGHAVRGTCPLYELEYGRGEIIQQTSILADITGFYSAFGVELTEEGNERPDHVSVECEFMSILSAKEAYAIHHEKDSESLKILCDAQRSFLEDHLARWMPSLARRVDEADPDGCYGVIARFAGAFNEAECRRLDINPGSSFLELRPVDSVRDATLSCGPETCASSGESPLVQVGVDPSSKQGGPDFPT